jgi:hypothetical protein
VTTRLLETLKPGDWLKEVLLVGESVFYRARFELFALDRSTGAVSSSNLFQYDSLSRALPSVGGAVVVPEGQGSGVSAELVRDLGQGGALVRPGRYRTVGTGRCEPINELSTGVNRVVSRLTYFCGDHFVEISLN